MDTVSIPFESANSNNQETRRRVNLNQKKKNIPNILAFSFCLLLNIFIHPFIRSFVCISVLLADPFYVFVSSFSLMLHITADVYNGYPIVRFVISNICSMLRPSVFVVFGYAPQVHGYTSFGMESRLYIE